MTAQEKKSSREEVKNSLGAMFARHKHSPEEIKKYLDEEVTEVQPEEKQDEKPKAPQPRKKTKPAPRAEKVVQKKPSSSHKKPDEKSVQGSAQQDSEREGKKKTVRERAIYEGFNLDRDLRRKVDELVASPFFTIDGQKVTNRTEFWHLAGKHVIEVFGSKADEMEKVFEKIHK
ncbi:hypothetical protein [Geoalkalibacter subterraneus]|uniref:Uncharacterized protein n=1 Tax=Geoalkalibacter subterraneus TaxID=483547 RepID=A0A0B5FJ24_9BACT|nr:hypothetical protein [Geoalkalibacter subterraneus]AJF08182.1 hypothetical protein GSUB_16945 [Geoalkalibacter subterraneus]